MGRVPKVRVRVPRVRVRDPGALRVEVLNPVDAAVDTTARLVLMTAAVSEVTVTVLELVATVGLIALLEVGSPAVVFPVTGKVPLV